MRKFLSVIAVATALALPAAAPTQAASLIFVPSSASTTVGGTASFDIVITGLTAIDEIVSAYDLNVLYNNAIANAIVITQFLAPFGGAANVLTGASFAAGNAGLDLVSLLDTDAELDALQGDSITIGSITFQGLVDGFTIIRFGPDPDFERNVVGRNALSLSLTYGTACLAVGTGSCPQIPEPNSLALMAIALLGLFAVARRRRRD